MEEQDRYSRESNIDSVYFLKQDLIKYEITIDFFKAGIRVNKDNVDSLGWQLFAKGFTANDESEKKSQRVGAAWRTKKANAAKIVVTKNVPGWLHVKDGVIKEDKTKANVVRRMFDSVASGKPIRTVMRELNAEGIATFGKGKQNKGAGWSQTHMRRILTFRGVLMLGVAGGFGAVVSALFTVLKIVTIFGGACGAVFGGLAAFYTFKNQRRFWREHPKQDEPPK
jgi:DNA invertase Pin-like site-specific DNA recombinase